MLGRKVEFIGDRYHKCEYAIPLARFVAQPYTARCSSQIAVTLGVVTRGKLIGFRSHDTHAMPSAPFPIQSNRAIDGTFVARFAYSLTGVDSMRTLKASLWASAIGSGAWLLGVTRQMWPAHPQWALFLLTIGATALLMYLLPEPQN
jgi:hypothetical protein